jgi:hypothetical protein
MANLLFTNQYVTTTLNVGGGIDSSQTTGIILTGVTGIDITKPGMALVNYADPLVTSTCEWIEYSSIDGSNELQGVVRGSEGFSAKAHSNGVTIAFPLSESHINRIATVLAEVTADGIAVGKATTQTLTNKTLTAPVIDKHYGAITTDSDGATVTMDCSVSRHQVILGGNRIIALTNLSTGQVTVADLIQDSTGSRTVTQPSFGATATMTIATPCVVTTGKDLPTLTPVVFTTTGALPTGVTASTTYYYVRVDATTGNIATSVANAQAGTLIASSGTQSGVHTCAVQIRWVSQTAPTLSTGKYLKDRINFYVIDATNTVVEGMVAAQGI